MSDKTAGYFYTGAKVNETYWRKAMRIARMIKSKKAPMQKSFFQA